VTVTEFTFSAAPTTASVDPACPHVIEVCRACLDTEQLISYECPDVNLCSSQSKRHTWSNCKVCIILPSKKRLRAMPARVLSGRFRVCLSVSGKFECQYGEEECLYAHSNEECYAWTWMFHYQGNEALSSSFLKESNKHRNKLCYINNLTFVSQLVEYTLI
jgi:hypothetical protein